MRNDLWTKGLVVGIIMLFIGTSVLPSTGTDLKKKEIVTEKTEKSDGWWYYPSLPNYAPSGLPDFNQDQDNWGNDPWHCGCGEVSCCDILWYLDSKYSDRNGIPGDGIDEFPLVQDYHARGTPNPGPYSDDHNFNNVNDPISSWNVHNPVDDFEFIEQYCWYEYYHANWDSINNYWIAKAGLSSQIEGHDVYYNIPISNFDFSEMVHDMADKIMSGDYYYVLQMDLVDSKGNWDGCHCVAIAGINLDEMKIAVSDPAEDQQNYTNNLYLHNDAKYVSHDIFTLTSDVPKWNWGIDYRSPHHHSNTVYGVVNWVLVIRVNHPPVADANGPYGTTDKTIQFNGAGSLDSDGIVNRYLWRFGDGSTSTEVNPTHIYSNYGVYNVTLTVIDDDGLTDTDRTLAIINKGTPPIAQLLYPTNGEVLNGTVTVRWSAHDVKDGDNLPIYIYFREDNTTLWSAFKGNPYPNNGTCKLDTTTLSIGSYKLLIEAVDSEGNIGADISSFQITNHEPVKPNTPSGPIKGKAEVEYSYTTSTTDPDGDNVYYIICGIGVMGTTVDGLDPTNLVSL